MNSFQEIARHSSWKGTGASALVDHVPEPAVFECHLVRLRPEPCFAVPRFLSLYLNSALVRRRTVAIAQTTTMSTIGQNELACLPVNMPTNRQVRRVRHRPHLRRRDRQDRCPRTPRRVSRV